MHNAFTYVLWNLTTDIATGMKYNSVDLSVHADYMMSLTCDKTWHGLLFDVYNICNTKKLPIIQI